MTETEQTAGSCPANSSTKGPPSGATSRFHGDGVRYKAKVIGVDPVPESHGEKMCWDTMMKLKGFEAAGRKQGKHKQRVWLKISSSGLKIVDERSGTLLHDHERGSISSLTKDESDPRALSYVYQHQDAYSLFYIKMANMADPVLADIKEVCEAVDQETPQGPVEAPTQTNSLLVLNDSAASPAEGTPPEDLFSPRPDPSSEQSNQASSSNELMEVFSIQMEEPIMPNPSLSASLPESPQPTLSTSQILSMFPTQPAGVSPYSSPPYSPTTMPWGQQQGPLGNQWAAPAMAPWPTMPGGMAAGWAPAAGVQAQASVPAPAPAPGPMGGNIPFPAASAMGYPGPSQPLHAPSGATGTLQSASPTPNNNLLL